MLRTEEQVRVAAPTKEGEMEQNGKGRAWSWRVEPGMEDAFQDLLGWMLPSQRGAEIETASSPPQPSAQAPAETQPAPRAEPTDWARGRGRLASEPGSLAV